MKIYLIIKHYIAKKHIKAARNFGKNQANKRINLLGGAFLSKEVISKGV